MAQNRIEIPESFAYQDSIGQSRWNNYTASAVHFRFNGTPTISARYYTVGRLCHAQVRVEPGTSLTTYQASSFVTLPITAQGYAGNASCQTDGPNHVRVGSVVVSTSVVRLEDSGLVNAPLNIFAVYEI